MPFPPYRNFWKIALIPGVRRLNRCFVLVGLWLDHHTLYFVLRLACSFAAVRCAGATRGRVRNWLDPDHIGDRGCGWGLCDFWWSARGAVSDTINGVGLLIVGTLVPLFGLYALGEGSISQGLNTVLQNDTHKLNAIGTSTDPVPFATLFTGMLLANLFYWGTNQYVIQRTLGAKNLAEGQKGRVAVRVF